MTAFYKQSWFAPVASAATSFLFPSLGSTIGGALNLSGQTADLVGNALVGAGIGGLSNGMQGALTGALAGAGTRYAANALGYGGGYQQLLGGLGALGGGTGTVGGAGGGMRDSNILTTNGVTGGNAGSAATGAASSGGGGALANLTGAGLMKNAPLLLAGASLMGGLAGAGKPKPAVAPGITDPNMTAHLPKVEFQRDYQPYQGDYRRYAMDGGGHQFFSNSQLPSTQYAADGGYMTAYGRGGVSGPGDGRDDKIPALLSDGEYIWDAESVSLLGNGSSKAGAEKLDKMREELRRQKGRSMSRGQMSQDSKPALAYLKDGR